MLDLITKLLSKRIDSVLVIDISSGLTLLNLNIKNEIKVTAAKVSVLASDKIKDNLHSCL
jgi:hypothetical protein